MKLTIVKRRNFIDLLSVLTFNFQIKLSILCNSQETWMQTSKVFKAFDVSRYKSSIQVTYTWFYSKMLFYRISWIEQAISKYCLESSRNPAIIVAGVESEIIQAINEFTNIHQFIWILNFYRWFKKYRYRKWFSGDFRVTVNPILFV